MKKTTLIIAVLLASVTTFGQDLTSKMGETILPEEGDYAIGINATPLLEYLGNFIGGDGLNSAPVWNDTYGSSSTPVIFGRMFVDANTAYRGSVRLGFGSDKTITPVADMSEGSDPGDTVDDEVKVGGTNITLGGGIEYRRGNSRLQGYWGPQAMIMLGSSKTTTTYGNDIEDTGEFSRETEFKSGGMTTFAVGGFVGAEFFFAPKMSVGGEYGWGLGLTSQGASSTTIETYDGNDSDTETFDGGKSSSFGVDTSIFGDLSLRMMFHF